MRYMLAILLNDIAQIEYDREKPLDTNQAEYLDSMDEKMNVGLQLGEQEISAPTLEQRAEFVATNLYHAIKADSEGMVAAMATYLAVKIPDLKQVKYLDKEGDVSIELVYDEVYKKQIAVSFN